MLANIVIRMTVQIPLLTGGEKIEWGLAVTSNRWLARANVNLKQNHKSQTKEEQQQRKKGEVILQAQIFLHTSLFSMSRRSLSHAL